MWTKKAVGHATVGFGALLGSILTGSLGLTLVGLFFLAMVMVGYVTQRGATVAHARTVSSERIQEDNQVQVQLELTGRGVGTGFAEVRDTLDERLHIATGSNYRIVNLPRGKTVQMDYEINAPIRGVYGIGPVQLRKTDLFELFYNVNEVPESIDGLTVLPKSEELKEVKIKAMTPKILSGINPVKQPGIGSQFYALREYTTSDPMKDVNWKASARAGELIVNQWERESISTVTFIFDHRAVTGAGSLGANPLLVQCRAAASMAEYFVGERNSVQFVTYGDAMHTIQPDSGERIMYKVYERLAAIEPEGEMNLKTVASDLLPRLTPKSPVLVFTPLEDDPTVVDAITMLLSRELNLMVIVPSLPGLMKKSDDPIPDDEYEVRMLERQIQIRRLRGLGIPVVDWKPDERLELAVLGALLHE